MNEWKKLKKGSLTETIASNLHTWSSLYLPKRVLYTVHFTSLLLLLYSDTHMRRAGSQLCFPLLHKFRFCQFELIIFIYRAMVSPACSCQEFGASPISLPVPHSSHDPVQEHAWQEAWNQIQPLSPGPVPLKPVKFPCFLPVLLVSC